MNKLTIFEQNGSLWTDSREVAAMVDKRHDHLVRDIRGYIAVMEKGTAPNSGVSGTERNFAPSDFFEEAAYIDSTGRALPRFNVSKKGCEMVGNKLTGDKGILFTAAYVIRFNEMENAIHQTRFQYPPQCSSLGETASLVKINRAIMHEQKSSSSKIARQTELFYRQAGFDVIPDFVEPNYEQTVLETAPAATQQ